MDIIKAADNLVIEVEAGVWKLSSDLLGGRPLLTAIGGSAAMACLPVFAQARQLPGSGGLSVQSVQEVVVGWSQADKAWHLGLLLGSDVARIRGGRWCELANWPDDYALLSADQAERAGASLAVVIQRPFRFVEAPHMAPTTGPLNPDVLQAYVPPPVSQAVRAAQSAPPALPEEPAAAPTLSSSEATPDDIALADWMKPAAPPALAGEVLAKPDRTDHLYVKAAETLEQSGFVKPPEQQAVAEAAFFPVADVLPVVRVSREKAAPIALPIDLEGWTLRPIGAGLQWAHTGVWSLGTIWQIFFRLALGILFIFLSVLTLQSPYAPVQPVGLPYVGILLGIGLIYAGVRLTLSLLRTEAVVIDSTKRQVRRHLDLTSDIVDSYDFDEIQAVVVTQVAQQKHRGRNGQPDTMSHEAWLHLLLHEAHQVRGKYRRLKPEDSYVTIGHIDLTEGEIVEAHFKAKSRQRAPQVLFPDEVTTPAHKVALVMAQALGVEAYVDQR